MSGEFDLIKTYFSRVSAQTNPIARQSGVILGVADDCAIFTQTPGTQIATSKDLLVEGQHFFKDVDPIALGHKALAVNLSDLAAMGAKPIACLLGLALPEVNQAWLDGFSKGFYDLADSVGCHLIGGDTTRSDGGIVISVTVFGEVSPPYPMRSAAQVGDIIWVSGQLGEAHIALNLLFKKALTVQESELLAKTRTALEYPTPRLALGRRLSGLVHAMIDISDGFAQDLSHILEQSKVAAKVMEEQMPVSTLLAALNKEIRRQAIFAGGDVYELCFTAPPEVSAQIMRIAQELQVPVTAVGEIVKYSDKDQQLVILDQQSHPIHLVHQGFDHFKT